MSMTFNDAVNILCEFDDNSKHKLFNKLKKNIIDFELIERFKEEYFKENFDKISDNYKLMLDDNFLKYEEKFIEYNLIGKKSDNGWFYINRVECEDYLNEITDKNVKKVDDEKKYKFFKKTTITAIILTLITILVAIIAIY